MVLFVHSYEKKGESEVSEFPDFAGRPRLRHRRFPWLILVTVALLASVFGGAVGAYIFPRYIFGQLLPTPTANLQRANLALPPLTGQNTIFDQMAQGAVVEVAERVGPTVVGIVNLARPSRGMTTLRQQGTGSGIIFDATGLIVTNQHVIDRAAEIRVIFPGNVEVKAELVGEDFITDLAVLRINPADLPQDKRALPVAEFGDSDALRVGELAVAIGNPLGLQFQRTVTAGIISAVERTLTMDDISYEVIQTDAAINSGNSGGALANARGQIIGINQAKITASGVEGMGFAIPINVARPIIDDLVRNGRVIRPWLGIRGIALSPAISAQYGLTATEGIYIDTVVERSPAHRAGLRRGDIIITWNGERLNDFERMRTLISRAGINGLVRLEIRRGNAVFSMEVRLEAAP